MLVDDDPSILQVLARMLKDQGCRVIACRDGLEALDALDFVRPDLIISDLDMPLVDGVELFRRSRAISGSPIIPFVILSGTADAERRLREIRDDLAGFFQKPVSLEMLMRIVRPGEDPPPG
jgi:CheY-like chemotaxis protein